MPTDLARGIANSPLFGGIVYFYFTTCVVWAALSIAQGGALDQRSMVGVGPVRRFANWDGEWFHKVVDEGYEFKSSGPSSIAFFPAYPLVASGIAAGFDISSDIAAASWRRSYSATCTTISSSPGC